MNKVMLLAVAATSAACGPSQPSETVDFLMAHPERLKEVQRLWFLRRPAGTEVQIASSLPFRCDEIRTVTSPRRSALVSAAFLLPLPQQEL